MIKDFNMSKHVYTTNISANEVPSWAKSSEETNNCRESVVVYSSNINSGEVFEVVSERKLTSDEIKNLPEHIRNKLKHNKY